MKTQTLIIIGFLLVVALAFFYWRGSRAIAGAQAQPERDILEQDLEAAYNAGAQDANKQREKRERAALLTGGLSEVGRWLGIKPFG